MSNNVDVVQAFIQAWTTLDAAKLADYFAEDGCYHNMPLEPVVGRKTIVLNASEEIIVNQVYQPSVCREFYKPRTVAQYHQRVFGLKYGW